MFSRFKHTCNICCRVSIELVYGNASGRLGEWTSSLRLAFPICFLFSNFLRLFGRNSEETEEKMFQSAYEIACKGTSFLTKGLKDALKLNKALFLHLIGRN